jgi:2-oxoisovalerate dehydrogenase E1 component
MKRFQAFDPPEYLQWKPDPALQEAYIATLERDPARQAIVDGLSIDALRRLYAGLLRNRLHDITLKRWVKQGVISKAWLGTGEEAVTIGSVHALQKGDLVAPMIRNAGACHEMGMSLADMFRGSLGTDDSPTRGRDLHFGDLRNGVIAPISHVGAVIPVTVGAAMGFKMKRLPHVAMTWVGDGSTKTGDFHEGVNLAAVQQAPAIIVIQNNQVALGTRLAQHQRGRFEDFARAYGIPGATFDGNNVLDAYATCRIAVDRARRGEGPSLLVAETFRMGGHATHDEREARECFPAELFTEWGRRDPIGLYEEYLVGTKKLTRSELEAIEADVTREIDAAEAAALASRSSHPADAGTVLEGVYA